MTYETMQTIHRPLYSVTPVLWCCGELCGPASVRITPTCPLAWLLGAIARASK